MPRYILLTDYHNLITVIMDQKISENETREDSLLPHKELVQDLIRTSSTWYTPLSWSESGWLMLVQSWTLLWDAELWPTLSTHDRSFDMNFGILLLDGSALICLLQSFTNFYNNKNSKNNWIISIKRYNLYVLLFEPLKQPNLYNSMLLS